MKRRVQSSFVPSVLIGRSAQLPALLAPMPTGAAGAAASAVRSAVTTASSTAASVTATRPVVMTAAAATVTTSDNIGGAVINSDAAPAYRRPHSAATAQPLDRPLTLETWKAPFEALQRLIDRTHRDGAAARRGATEHSPSAAGHGGLAGRGSGASRNHQLTYLEKRELAQREQERANRLRRDPMAMMDQLFARARRKWIDLCVTMRVPEDERVLIEGQVERRDEPLTMRNALQTLHSEIERLTNLFNWTAMLRRAVDAREAKLAALCEHVSALAAPAHPLAEDTSDGCGGDAGAASRLRADVRRGRSMAAARAEVCRTTLELVLAVRHASADVFSAHRRWQLAHGSTAPLPMFMYRGAAYLEKMVGDVAGVVADTDAIDIERAVWAQASASASPAATATGRDQAADASSRNGPSQGIGGGAAAGRRASAAAVAVPNSAVDSIGASHAVAKTPAWAFAFVSFRICRANALLDVRRLRVANIDAAEADMAAGAEPEIGAAVGAANARLEALLRERCGGWGIDEYYQCAARALADARGAAAQARGAAQERAARACVAPAALGSVRGESVAEFAADCEHALGQERCLVERLLRQSAVDAAGDGDDDDGGGHGDESDAWTASAAAGAEALRPQGTSPATSAAKSSPRGGAPRAAPHVDHIVVLLQKYVRRHLARARVRRMLEARVAATLIQAAYRGLLVRRRVGTLRTRWRCARRIQAWLRGCFVRVRIAEDAEARRAARMARERVVREANRAVAAQQQQQQQQQRPLGPANRMLVIAGRAVVVSPPVGGAAGASLRSLLDAEATKIQAAVRGWRERDLGAGIELREWRVALRLHAAVAKIQAVVRGVLVRNEARLVRRLGAVVRLQRVGRGQRGREAVASTMHANDMAKGAVLLSPLSMVPQDADLDEDAMSAASDV